ncbi:transglutaminase domain-containing protein [Paenibacillus rhizovicinus]|uniref:Transglutaminase domain-containing protein n=1 Tax=Paenibacillus rhizovicinus TaxID=2704463 RepID=A0A6C0P1J7_9BACL|nr:transglutaminase domain-containing protein [Paenibacillus rhizovicinus]QHW32345.1 transglutaminase domain-containing protein [Paenibacillus rhizovicinus]
MTLSTSIFSLDQETMDQIERKFRVKQQLAEARQQELFGIFQEELTDEETWALKYMFAFMPVNDMADYDGSLFLNHVRQSLDIRRQVPWGSRVPDHLFLHYVLPYRVNTENIEDSRGILYRELAERTASLSMAEAILETNYWCQEKATYIGSDLRTLSPLSMIRNARGRCGEESTLAVAALRSIGIPARQVYTPRWAHCDDNHAWVEAWADGQWHYIGACEPEARLDQGWFTPPARRAMLVNTRIFADYPGPEDITLAHEWFTEINLLDNYAPTRTIQVTVKDMQGAPAAGAEVRFELYNMAELFPIAAVLANDEGQAAFKTGLGDLVIRAVKDGYWAEAKISVPDCGAVELVLNASEQPAGSVDFDMVPPPEREGEPVEALPEAKIQRHNGRLEEGTKCRTSYEENFLGEADARALAEEAGLPADRVWSVIQKARGNSREIAAFLREQSGAFGEWPLRLLETLNDKDLIDTFRPALEDHLTGALANRGTLDEDEFVRYVLCPRVLNEMLVPYRQLLQGAFTAEEVAAFRADPSALVRSLQQGFGVWTDLPNLMGRGNPAGTYKLKLGDPLSLDILFVAICRSLGIPARLHPSEQRAQYLQQGGWQDAAVTDTNTEKGTNTSMGTNTEKGTNTSMGTDTGKSSGEHAPRTLGRLQLIKDTAASQDAPVASYAENFTFARLENGAYKTLVYPDGKKDVYDEPFEAEPGQYRLTTGIRLKDGTVRVRLAYFIVRAGETTEVALTFRETTTDIPVLGTFDRSRAITLLDGAPAELRQLLGAGIAITAWIEPEREPTKHLFRELSELAEPLNQLGTPIVLLIGDTEMTASFDPADYPKLPSRTVFVRDASREALPDLIVRSSANEAGFPHLFVVDDENRIRYTASGYKIGTGKEALQVMTGLIHQ